MAHLLLSAAHKSSGKTTLGIGLCAALTQRGNAVQPFKKGPDYIDPIWLGLAAARPCYNLDFNTMASDEIRALTARHLPLATLGLIEGNKGLYDGVALDGSDSNAALAKLLKAPVILVIDTRGMTRGIAPLVLGYRAFDPEVQVAGVILNRVGGARHAGKLRAALEHYTDVPVLGAVLEDRALAIEERHLGLVPGNEESGATARIRLLGERVAEQVDLDRLTGIARTAPDIAAAATAARPATGAHLRIGIVRDSAFGFYYADDLQALEASGAELVAIDSLHDARLPEIDGLFIGGGFPETHMQALARNSALRGELRQAIEGGLPTYAECGGLMYLARSLRWHDQRCDMVGVIPAEAVMGARPSGRGYVQLRETPEHPWALAGEGAGDSELRAHEFHYSYLEGLPADSRYGYRVLRGTGIDGEHDGIVHGNLFASYAHLRHTAQYPWASRFLAFVRSRRLAPHSTDLPAAGRAAG